MNEIDLTPEVMENAAAQEAAEAEQETAESVPEAAEAAETGENAPETEETEETVGYSSEYYKHEAARAIANGNRIAYDNAMNNYGKALVREQTSKFNG